MQIFVYQTFNLGNYEVGVSQVDEFILILEKIELKEPSIAISVTLSLING